MKEENKLLIKFVPVVKLRYIYSVLGAVLISLHQLISLILATYEVYRYYSHK
jgi:hypothetical protein